MSLVELAIGALSIEQLELVIVPNECSCETYTCAINENHYECVIRLYMNAHVAKPYHITHTVTLARWNILRFFVMRNVPWSSDLLLGTGVIPDWIMTHECKISWNKDFLANAIRLNMRDVVYYVLNNHVDRMYWNGTEDLELIIDHDYDNIPPNAIKHMSNTTYQPYINRLFGVAIKNSRLDIIKQLVKYGHNIATVECPKNASADIMKWVGENVPRS